MQAELQIKDQNASSHASVGPQTDGETYKLTKEQASVNKSSKSVAAGMYSIATQNFSIHAIPKALCKFCPLGNPKVHDVLQNKKLAVAIDKLAVEHYKITV